MCVCVCMNIGSNVLKIILLEHDELHHIKSYSIIIPSVPILCPEFGFVC